MGVKITEVGIEFAGAVTRKYDKVSDMTTLVVSESQARDIYDSLKTVVGLFDSQNLLV
jgi:hypothetical protein